MLAKLYLAEGVAVGHPLFVASKNTDVNKLVSVYNILKLKQLFIFTLDISGKHVKVLNLYVSLKVESIPPEIETSNASTKSSETSKEADGDLKIAWRYQHLPSGNSANSGNPNQFGHHFDLSRSLAPEIIAASNVTKWTEKSSNRETSEGSITVALKCFWSNFLIKCSARFGLRN